MGSSAIPTCSYHGVSMNVEVNSQGHWRRVWCPLCVEDVTTCPTCNGSGQVFRSATPAASLPSPPSPCIPNTTGDGNG